jgi:hypothetical protein
MKRILILIAVLITAYPAAASAVTGLAFGGSVGFASYSGDVLPGSGDVGEGLQYGLVLEITTLPVIDLEFQANYFTKDFTYTYDVSGVPVSADFEFRDINFSAVAKKNLMPIPTSPLGLYVGGGVGWHVMNTEVAKGVSVNPALADNPFSLAANTGKPSAEGMLGIKIAPPVFPLAIFGEYRFGRIFADESVNTSSFEAGMLLKF